MAQGDSSEQSREMSRHSSYENNEVVDYDQIQVELDEDVDIEDERGDHQGDSRHHDNSGSDDDAGEQEVSINLEDAIATAEEINK